MIRIGVEASALTGRRTGVGRYTLELLAAASASNGSLRLSAVVPHDRPLDPGTAEEAGVSVKSWPRGTYKVLRLADMVGVHVPFELLAGRQDVMLFPNYRWFPTWRAATLTVIHDLGFQVVPECVEPTYLPRLRGYVEQAVEHSDVIATVSETVAQELADAYPQTSGRVVTLRSGAPNTLSAEPPTDWRVRLGRFELEPGFLLHVGTLEPRKNLVRLIEAIHLLPRAVAETHPLVLVGPRGWQDDAIMAAIEGAGDRVVHLDFVTDVDLRALYEGAAMLVFPSRYEGFGLPVVEAMRFELPVACSDIPVLHEVSGGAAAFFDHTDPHGIASTVARLIDDRAERERLAAAGRLRAATFSWRRTGQRFVDIVTELARGS